jgi:hypothetical protein
MSLKVKAFIFSIIINAIIVIGYCYFIAPKINQLSKDLTKMLQNPPPKVIIEQ